jgi:predicted  nucleic acid-binding Zn-ribbon protein
MRLQPLSIVLLTVFTAGCATAVDMDAVNRRVSDNTKRIEALERSQSAQQSTAASETAKEIDSLQKDLNALKERLAASDWTVGQLTEKVESLKAFMDEIQRSTAQLRKKGGEIDKTLEEMTNRLETQVRTLADRLRQMLEDESGK